MDEPVFLAGSHRGLSISGAPMSSPALTEYLRERGQRIGYRETITFYSLRRRTATDFTLLVGADHARRLLGHGPKTRTLERYYLNDVNRTNLSGMALGETTNPRINDNTRFYTDLSTTAIGAEEVREIYGTFLNDAVSAYIAEDRSAPRDGSVKEYNNYRRRVSRLIFRSLLEERSKKLEASLTQAEAEERIEQARTNNIMSEILRRARTMSSEPQLEDRPVPGMLPEGGFDMTFTEAPPEPDLNTQPLPADGLFVRQTDEEIAEELPGIPYVSCVRLTMELLLEFNSQPHAVAGQSSILPRPRVNNQLRCLQCQEEEHIDDSHRDRVWPSKPHLKRHMDSDFHSPLRKLQRKIQYQHTITRKWLCPFCEELKHPRTVDYGCIGKVTRHIESSGNSLHVWGNGHEQLKAKAGFNQTWRKNENGGASARVRYDRKKRAEGFAQRAKLLRSYGIIYTSGDRPPVNQPTGHKGVVVGDQSEPLNPEDLAAFEELVPINDIPPNIELPNDLEGCFVSSTAPVEIPGYLSTQFLA
jgi:hypothetical protein